MKKFALDLEKILYECQQEELKKTAEKRVDTVDKVDFIKKCLFMFYEIPEMARRTTWTAVRNSLDSRARRRRSAREEAPHPNVCSDPFHYESE
ncbi:hypothetical protein Q1695_010698 [Nippostrongylus brasiliensis]|nr:hypothetical protein Q1695_009336 [Nippostrongylus brasiliensis]WKX92867.1 hypothetical protein Q1695_010698 [Nippostrongylus brasiliensis]